MIEKKRRTDDGIASNNSKACNYCKKRKIKCNSNVEIPCSNCLKRNITCTQSNDNRTSRPSVNDIHVLEERIRELEKCILNMKQNQNAASSSTSTPTPTSTPSSALASTPTHRTNDPNLNYNGFVLANKGGKYPQPRMFNSLFTMSRNNEIYGPTSIFNAVKLQDDKNISDDTSNDSILLPATLSLLNKDKEIIKYIKKFFQWFYPDINMFIPRETFLVEFYHPRSIPTYCSVELIYAVCSIGSLLDIENGDPSTNLKISKVYFNHSKKLLFRNLNNSSITSLQSFLLLGLYEFYNGNNNSSWLLIGIGLRIGFNIGFHRSTKKPRMNKLLILFKSRIYWGCFILDHFISLVLGRPSVLRINYSTIEDSERVPDLDWIKEFNFQEINIIDVSNPLKSLIKLVIITDNGIKDIFLTKTKIKDKTRLERVGKFNAILFQWRLELIDELKWHSKEDLAGKSTKPPDMIHIYYYYIVFLSVNKEFISSSPEIGDVVVENMEHLDVAVAGFVVKYGFNKCSILIIYSSILVVNIIISIVGNDAAANGKAAEHANAGHHSLALQDLESHALFNMLLFHLNILRENGKVYHLSKKCQVAYRTQLLQTFGFDCDAHEWQYPSHGRAADSEPAGNPELQLQQAFHSAYALDHAHPPDPNPVLQLHDNFTLSGHAPIDAPIDALFASPVDLDFGTEWVKWMSYLTE